MEEWGLQAVVRGFPRDQFTTTTSTTNNIDGSNLDNSCFSPFLDFDKEFDQELVFSFPEPFDTTTVMMGNELEELYKPFCPTFIGTAFSDHPQTMIADVPNDQVMIKEEEDQMEPFFGSPFISTTAPSPTIARAAKHKTSRKNQQKKVVRHVTADGLSSDLWAWRKYGQKPIKGSPYPRSYYRCSSSKGCLARRQVEQSYTNPGMYIITYTAEHNHAQPTRRNSLAGVNRHKFGTLRNHMTTAINGETANTTNISNDSPILSPATTTTSPLNSSVEELEVVQQQPISKEERIRDSEEEDQEQTMGESGTDRFIIPDIMLSDDFFAGLGNLDEVLMTASDSSFQNCLTKQFPVSFCS